MHARTREMATCMPLARTGKAHKDAVAGVIDEVCCSIVDQAECLLGKGGVGLPQVHGINGHLPRHFAQAVVNGEGVGRVL